MLITKLKHSLHTAFTIKDLGHAKFFLGLEIARSNEGVSVTQKKYINDIIFYTGLIQAKGVPTPLPPGLQLQEDDGDLLEDPSQYRRVIGRLLYLIFSHPDIMYSV